MPASAMQQTVGTGNGASATGKAVICNPFSGPTGALFDSDQTGNASTGACVTGIGFGIGTRNEINPDAIAPQFTDAVEPGVTLPDGTDSTLAVLTAIGGGFSDANGISDPYDAVPLLAFGNGGNRDSSAGLGFGMQLVTATAPVAHAGVIETGFVNRVEPGFTLGTGYSAFGSATAASASPV